MGRTRVIDREAVLLAAERVITRDGAARVTLEAVAAEAGISKASVLYDYKTKQALLKAFGSVARLRRTAPEAIAALPGFHLQLAQNILRFLESRAP